MKKLLSLILALTFIVCLFSLSSVASAADEDGEKSVWEEEHKEFISENGTVTKVYDNGCVKTVYPDGSEEAVDFDGNRYTKDKDGTQMAYMTDGTIGKKFPDGTVEYKLIDGTKWINKTDGTAIAVNMLGLCTEYDKDENAKYMYFESGGKKITLDENGELPAGKGEIKGKNGEKFSWVNKGKDGETEYSTTTTVNDKTSSLEIKFGADGSGSINIQRYDGLTVNSLFDSDGNVTGFVKSGSFSAKIDLKEDGSGSVSNSAGDSATVDKYGNTVINTADGLILKYGSNTAATEFYDRNSGNELVTDSSGKVVKFKNYNTDGSSMTYEDGVLNVKNSDGSFVRSVENEDGSKTVTTSSGDKYLIDSDGAIYKNGLPVKNGSEPSSEPEPTSTGKTNDSGKDNTQSGSIKTKNETFFGVTLPVPNVGKVTVNETETNSFGDEVTTIRIDGMSYAQYIEYCKILEALPGWEIDDDDDVAHFPSDYNSVSSKVRFTGSYKSLPHIAVHYYTDANCKSTGYPHFCMFVYKTF